MICQGLLAGPLSLLIFICFLELGHASYCKVALPQNSSTNHCYKNRQAELEAQRKIWHLKPPPAFPFTRLNMSMSDFVKQVQANPFMGTHAKALLTLSGIANATYYKYMEKTASLPAVPQLEEDYVFMRSIFKPIPLKHMGEIVRRPENHDTFQTDQSKWLSDQLFAEQRLAGVNPMALQQVTFSNNRGIHWDDLKMNLNPTFNWNEALANVLKYLTCGVPRRNALQWAIRKKFVYAFRVPMCDDMVTMKDLYKFPGEGFNRTMWPLKSPIGLFVTVLSGDMEKESVRKLMPVAIQMDYKRDSPVYTPTDGGFWTFAKLNLQLTDFAYSQMVEHLCNVHFITEVICISMDRHIHPLHPLYVIMKYHCRGTVTANTLGAPKLISPNWFEHHLHPYGWEGAVMFIQKAAEVVSWDGSDLRANLKRRGMNNKKALPYYPYRDDGLAILGVIEDMVSEYVNIYYPDEYAVRADFEVQRWVSEISADGTGPFGGTGKIRNFPPKLTTRAELKDVLTRMIWLMSGQHSAVNYPANDYGAYTPNMPTKLYNDTRGAPDGSFSMYSLGHRNNAALQIRVFQNLGLLRLDTLFDYAPSLDDGRARAVVSKYYDILQRRTGSVLDARNKMRKRKGHLTYPYMEPRWLTNGAQT